jgi:hypothetical protein
MGFKIFVSITERLASNEIRWPYGLNRRGHQINSKNLIGFVNTIMKLWGLDSGDFTWLASTSLMDVLLLLLLLLLLLSFCSCFLQL